MRMFRCHVARTYSTIAACTLATLLWCVAPLGGEDWRPTGGQARYGGGDADPGTADAAGERKPDPFGPVASGASRPTTPVASGITPIGSGGNRANVTEKSPTLPRSQNQVWREYDIRPYTLRVANTNRPEQAIVDWILRETGYEAWHAEPVGLLTANRQTLSVYHTPAMQEVVAGIVDRFVNSQSAAYSFSLRIATVVKPNWRAKALPLMTPIPVQSPGVQGWLVAKEDAALLLSELRRRTDFREYNSSGQLVPSGQSVVISTMRPRPYMKGIVHVPNAWPGYQPEMGQLEEGFSLEFNPLLSMDMASADAVIKLRLNQVEKMLPVKLDLPTTITPNQQVEVEVPQMTTANLHERFRWPTDKILLLSMGVVATPGQGDRNPLTSAMPEMLKSPPRADALLSVECRPNSSPANGPVTPVRAAALPQQSFQGRY